MATSTAYTPASGDGGRTPIKTRNTNNVALMPSPASQDGLIKYFNNTTSFLNNNFNLREQFLRRDRSYYREEDFTDAGNRAKWQNRAGNPKPIQNITIPVVMPQVESAVAYLADIFLTGYPIFPVLSKPDQSPAALQMETLVGEHSVKYGWPSQLMMNLRDGLKYNLMAVEVTWQNNKTWSVATDNMSPQAAAKATETYYQGNVLKRLSPYNLIIDTRVQNPAESHKKAEFLGYTELKNRIELKQLFADLGPTATMNAKDAFESGTAIYTSIAGTNGYYIPQVNPVALLQPSLTTTDWMQWGGLAPKDGIKYHNMYEVSVLYCRIIPSDFNLNTSAPNTVQIYKLIVVNRKILIHCERQTNAHNFLPIIIGQPTEDGLGWQSKSFGENADPMQSAATALYTSGIESQRRKVYDRIFYDPSRINKVDINNVDAVARIPVKQVAYGQNIAEAIHVAPYIDNGVAEILAMSKDIAQMADTVNGSNKVQQGQFQKGNKSRKEFETVMGNANGRLQIMAILLEYQFFQPIKEIIKLNILQFQPPTTLYNRNSNQQVAIDPVAIRAEALEFRIADGLLPEDKMVNVDSLSTILQMTAQNPQMAAEFDIVGMIMYVMQLSGASWIQDFRRTPPQQQQFLQNTQAVNGTTNAAGQPVQPTVSQPPGNTQSQPNSGASPSPG